MKISSIIPLLLPVLLALFLTVSCNPQQVIVIGSTGTGSATSSSTGTGSGTGSGTSTSTSTSTAWNGIIEGIEIVRSYTRGGYASDVAGSGDHIFSAHGALQVFDIPSAGHLSVSYTVPTPGYNQKMVLDGTKIYLTTGASGLSAIDITDPANASFLSYAAGNNGGPNSWTTDICTNGAGHVYMSEYGSGISIFDISTPSSVTKTGNLTHDDNHFNSVMIKGNYLYAGQSDSGVAVFDITTPETPIYKTNVLQSGSNSHEMVAVGNYLYVCDGSAGLVVYDITNGAAPSFAGSASLSYPTNICTDGTYLFVTVSGDLKIFDITNPSSPTVVGTYSTSVNWLDDVSSYNNYIYLSEGSAGIEVINIATITSPTQSDLVQATSMFNAVAKRGTWLYGSDQALGIVAFDIADPEIPTWNTANSFGDPPNHATDIQIIGDFAYVTVDDYDTPANSGLRIYDISSPSFPYMTDNTPPNLTHCGAVTVSGNYAYVCRGNSGLTILNVSDKANIAILSTDSNPNTATWVNTSRVALYSSAYAYTADGDAGIGVFDISDPSNITFKTALAIPGDASTADVVIDGNYLFAAQETDGVAVYDLTSPLNPVCKTMIVPGGYVFHIAVVKSGTSSYLYIIQYDSPGSQLKIYDITDPTTISSVKSVDLRSDPQSIYMDPPYCYLGTTRGMLVFK